MGIGQKILIVITVGLVLTTFLFTSKVTLESTDQKPLFEVQPERRSITFLMGADNPGYQYFKLAEEHFLFSEEEKTDVLVKSCQSFEDLVNYLNNSTEPQPWSAIQVVLHGNPYSGLSLPIVNDGPRATPKNLVKAILENPLPSLNSNAVDSTTKINFWGCGIGKNPFINIALDSFFKMPNGGVPQIYTSPHFVVFKDLENGSAPIRLKASYWPYIYKRGYRPGDHEIASALKKQFPETEINWSKAVATSAPVEAQHEFQNSFHIPVSWTVIYPTKESRPAVTTENEKMQWVKSQEELMSKVEECNIPIEKFTWTVNKIVHTTESGEKVPAIKAIGMATVLCVLDTETDG
jgi:hypothetical protein